MPPQPGLPGPPMTTPLAPTPGAGMEAQARIKISEGVKAIIAALAILKDVRSEEAKACLTALKALEKVAPDVEDGVSQSQAQSVLESAKTAMAGPGAGLGLGRPPSPMAVGGMPFGMNSAVPSPGMG